MQQENDRGPRYQPNTGADAPPDGHRSAYMTAPTMEQPHAAFLGVLGVVAGTRDVLGPQWFDGLLMAAYVTAPTDESLPIVTQLAFRTGRAVARGDIAALLSDAVPGLARPGRAS